jgi:hypothetical protein
MIVQILFTSQFKWQFKMKFSLALALLLFSGCVHGVTSVGTKSETQKPTDAVITKQLEVSVYDLSEALGATVQSINNRPLDEARRFLVNKTIMTISTYTGRNFEGAQIEYFNEAGHSFLWMPNNPAPIRRVWKIRRNKGRYDVCQKIRVLQSIQNWTCHDLGDVSNHVLEIQSQDIFLLSSLTLPFDLSEEKHSFGELFLKGGGPNTWKKYVDAMKAVSQKKYTRAHKYFLALAQEGHFKSQYQLAQLQLSNVENLHNPLQALSWLNKAANAGFSEAQFLLGNIYAQGEHIQKDYVEAMKWFTITMSDSSYKFLQDRAKKQKESIIDHLSPPELQEAGKLETLWREKFAN